MEPSFLIIAGIIAISGMAAIMLPQQIHCGLCAALCFLGTGALYLYLDAEFIGLIQLMVYVGAVAVLILFTILLTRPMPEPGDEPPVKRVSFWSGALAGIAVAIVLGSLFLMMPAPEPLKEVPLLKIEALGVALTTTQVVPLMVVALLLTSALIGAVIIASPEQEDKS